MRTMDELDVAGKRVLLRLDLNVPMHDGHIADDGKIRACLPTVTHLLAQGAAVVVCSHLGRPPGAPDPAFSLAPVAARLGELVHQQVTLTADTVGPAVQSAVADLAPRQVLLLQTSVSTPVRQARSTPSTADSLTSSQNLPTCTWATGSVPCTDGMPVCTTSLPGCRTRRVI